MAINFGESELVSTLQEIVGFKGGLAVTMARIDELVRAAPEHIRAMWPQPATLPTRIQAEDFQELVSWLLFRLGTLPSHLPTAHERLMIEEADAPPELRPTYQLVMSALVEEITRQTLARVRRGENPFANPQPLDMTGWVDRCFSAGGRAAFDLALRVLGYVKHDSIAFAWNRVRRIEWQDEATLDDLFHDAGIDPVHGRFFDQRYIDYLSANSVEIGAIHWRQFERLTAEFFERQGYKVDLGPGTGDGGVDVRVWRKDSDGPPLILIQCKRWKDVVQQVHVKALYADVLDEKATSGLVVTTSRLEPAAAKWCEAHSYQIDAAERPTLRVWIEHLRTTFE